MLTDAQREAAIERMARGMAGVTSPSTPLHRLTLADAERALDALLTGFVVIAKDDVTEERRGSAMPLPERRLVTRWEPITKEDENAVDAGESIVPGLQTDSTGGTA